MARAETGDIVRGLDRLFHSGTISGLDESALVDRFANSRDPAAFEAIVKRHGAMVWSVCRQTLRDPNDAADAFQATFLIFAARAGAIRRREKLGGWLHGVAMRVSSRARRDLLRRPPLLMDVADSSQDDHAESRERVVLLHEELARLPGKYRDPIVLCHLEGCTHDEAAARLGWPVGTVRGRLSRGRDRLRERLTRRGIAGALIGFESITPPIALSERTINAATATASVGKTAASLLSVQGATWLAWGVRTMMIKSWVLTGVVALGVVSASGAGVFAYAWQEGSKKTGEAKVEEKGVEPAIVKAGSQVKGIEIEVEKGKGGSGKEPEAIDPAEEKDELPLKIQALQGQLGNSVRTIVSIESEIRSSPSGERGLWLNDAFNRFSTENQRKPQPGEVEELTRQTILNMTNHLTTLRKMARESRDDLARMEGRLASLNAKVAEDKANLKEDQADELAKAEADLDVMTIDVQAMKEQWENTRSVVRAAEANVEQVNEAPPQVGLEDMKSKANEKLSASLAKAARSRSDYLKARLQLAHAQRRMEAMRHRAASGTIPSGGASEIEARLSRIEQALQRLEKKGK